MRLRTTVFYVLSVKKQPSFTEKKSAPAIGQNQSRDFGLSITNRHGRAQKIFRKFKPQPISTGLKTSTTTDR